MVACGRAVFRAGDKTETIDFSTFSELAEREDELVWKHWPVELVITSVEFTDAANAQQQVKAA